MLDQIAEALDSAWANGSLMALRMRELINDIRTRDGVAKEKADIKEKERVTLNKSLPSILLMLRAGRDRRIKARTMRFYYDFTAWLKAKDYHMNSIGRSIKQLKVIMFTAEAEGFHMNPKWKDKRFKGTRVDVDTVYLTADELEKLKNADLGKLSNEHRVVRDIFLVGVWACQDNYFSQDFIESDGRYNPAKECTKEELASHKIRKITPTEAFMLQGFPAEFALNRIDLGALNISVA